MTYAAALEQAMRCIGTERPLGHVAVTALVKRIADLEFEARQLRRALDRRPAGRGSVAGDPVLGYRGMSTWAAAAAEPEGDGDGD